MLEEFGVIAPPVPVMDIAKDLGIKVITQRYPDDNVSGFYMRQGAERVIGVNQSHAPNRRRFTVAHELGHVLLTAHDDLHIDRSLMLRDPLSHQGTDWREVEANLFAAELLLPRDMVADVLKKRGGLDPDDARAVREVADHFGVSPQALLIRLTSLNFLLSSAS